MHISIYRGVREFLGGGGVLFFILFYMYYKMARYNLTKLRGEFFFMVHFYDHGDFLRLKLIIFERSRNFLDIGETF